MKSKNFTFPPPLRGNNFFPFIVWYILDAFFAYGLFSNAGYRYGNRYRRYAIIGCDRNGKKHQ